MRGDGRSGKVIQLVQTMGQTKKKKSESEWLRMKL